MNNHFIELAESAEEYAIAVRRHLHRHPELSGVEENTVAYIIAELHKLGIHYVNVPDGGVVGIIEGDERGKTLLLRADIDALPMQESPQNLRGTKTAVSEIDGVAHTCGHDGHTAMLLGAAKVIQENNLVTQGKLLLLFERGEEATSNIVNVIRFFEAKDVAVDAAFGIHLSSSMKSGQIGITAKPSPAGMLNFKATIEGRSNTFWDEVHSGDVVKCFGAVAGDILGYKLRQVSAYDQFSYSICTLHTEGEGENCSPRSLTFSGSARFFEDKTVADFADFFKDSLKTHAKLEGCDYRLDELEKVLGSVKNNRDVTALAKQALHRVFGAQDVLETEPSMGSETYSFLAELYPATFAFLGIKNDEIGTGADHHNPLFDVDDGVLKLGIAAHLAFVAELQENPGEIAFTKQVESIEQLLEQMQNV